MPSTISDAVAFPALFKKAAGLAGRVTPRVAGLGACLLGFVAFAISALFTVPILGLSDNHDFWRVMRPAGIQRLAERKDDGVHTPVMRLYDDSRPVHWRKLLSSSPSVFAWLSTKLRVFRHPDHYDIRNYALIAVLLFLGGVIAVGFAGTGLGFAAVLLWIGADPGYLLFFNSFLADTYCFIGLLWLIAAVARLGSPDFAQAARAEKAGVLVVLSLSLYLISFAKMQYLIAPVAVLVALGGWYCLRPTRLCRSQGLAVGIVLVFCVAAPSNFYLGYGPNFPGMNNRNALERGILTLAPEPVAVARSFGIPLTEEESRSRQLSWAAKRALARANASLSRWRLAMEYLKYPSAMLQAGLLIEARTAEIATTYHNHFEVTPAGMAKPPAQYETWWQFSRLRSLLVGLFPGALWLILALSALGWTWAARRAESRSLAAVGWLLLAFVLTQHVAVILGEGTHSLLRHLVGAKFAFDCLLALGICAGISRVFALVPALWRPLALSRRPGAGHSGR